MLVSFDLWLDMLLCVLGFKDRNTLWRAESSWCGCAE